MIRFSSNGLRGPALRWAQSLRLPRQCQSTFRLEQKSVEARNVRYFGDTSSVSGSAISQPAGSSSKVDVFKKLFNALPEATPAAGFAAGKDVVLHGFVGKRRDMSSKRSFCDLDLSRGFGFDSVQIVSNRREEGSAESLAHQSLRSVPAYSPVIVVGTLQESQQRSTSSQSSHAQGSRNWDLHLQSITCLNPFPNDIVVSKNQVWPRKSRHMQLRFDVPLRNRLYFRSFLHETLSKLLREDEFTEIETPLLFKSTPEGAREFIVPTRRPGYAYALPQSPQQYKQILMAGGFRRYFQFAKCFRDEDHRADRQPEFTQLDLEMSFATGKDMTSVLYRLVTSMCEEIRQNFLLQDVDGVRQLAKISRNEKEDVSAADEAAGRYVFAPIEHMTYEEAMSSYGSDKPDLRIQLPYVSPIRRMGRDDLSSEFISTITSLKDPIVDRCNFRLGVSPKDAAEFLTRFKEAVPASCTAAMLIYDSSEPLNGLSTLGQEAAQKLENAPDSAWGKYEDGDIIVMQARENEQFYGGSTDLGRLRTEMHEAAAREGLIPKDPTFRFLFVHSFPLFTPDGEDPGQGGLSGFSSTHHPFTAPMSPEDFDLLATDPLRAKADHYDLVLNGVEIGGGSRRIHVAEVQEYIMRDVLQMTDEGVAEFTHLLEALRSGCPPHAGFAFGFDRLLSVLLDVPSVKDVIAFPKSNSGEDLLVGSPAEITTEQLRRYNMVPADTADDS
ncbi:tRNA synthetases class II-domain-containing protein [Hypoxylon sp. FL1284]|nr:tRNA synthetases class II-domain-containing protein [Hypoxylon sp. FL1284]